MYCRHNKPPQTHRRNIAVKQWNGLNRQRKR